MYFWNYIRNMIYLILLVLAWLGSGSNDDVYEKPVDYTGHKVITVIPNTEDEITYLKELGKIYKLDFWSDPRMVGVPIMIRLRPEVIEEIEQRLKEAKIPFVIAIFDLESAIRAEKVANAPTPHIRKRLSAADMGKYYTYDEITQFLKEAVSQYTNIASLQEIGRTFENRPILAMKIGSGNTETKPVILIESGIHAREWVSVSSSLYAINELTSKYSTDSSIKKLVDDYTWIIIPSLNPDGYVYTWTSDRIWRKTRSRSLKFVPSWCRGADANRNFDIDHCGAGTSRDPCEDIYCGDAPFSENESRALKKLIENLGSRIKVYFAVHSYSQLWMTPYGYKKDLPSNYQDLMKICNIGITALRIPYGTNFRCGTISNIIYPAAGSSLDWAYEKAGVKTGFALELRDTGRYGFMLPNNQIIPTCEETWAGITAAIQAS